MVNTQRQRTDPAGRLPEPVVEHPHECGEELAQPADFQHEPQSDIGDPQSGVRRTRHVGDSDHLREQGGQRGARCVPWIGKVRTYQQYVTE